MITAAVRRMPHVPYLHQPLVVERDPDGEGIEDKDQAYGAESPTDDGDWTYHPELVLTSRQQVGD